MPAAHANRTLCELWPLRLEQLRGLRSTNHTARLSALKHAATNSALGFLEILHRTTRNGGLTIATASALYATYGSSLDLLACTEHTNRDGRTSRHPDSRIASSKHNLRKRGDCATSAGIEAAPYGVGGAARSHYVNASHQYGNPPYT